MIDSNHCIASAIAQKHIGVQITELSQTYLEENGKLLCNLGKSVLTVVTTTVPQYFMSSDSSVQ